MNLIDYIYQFDDLSSSKEIVFFGGSFNPWHKGHTTCIRLLPKHLPVVIVPDHNPFKDIVEDKNKLTTPEYIIKSLTSLNRNLFMYDGFLKLNQKNPTNRWIGEVKQNLPMTKLSLLVGYDTLKNMPDWIEIKPLLKNLSRIYVASRLEQDSEHETHMKSLTDINPSLNIVLLGHHEFEHISSTELRSQK